MIRVVTFLCALVASPAIAQGGIVSPLNPASGAAVSAAQGTADSALQAAQAAQAAIPPACSVAPSGDTLNGTVGNGAPCTPPVNNTRPTAVQAGNTTLAADCSFSISFARAFTSAQPFVYAAVVDNTNTQMPCKIKTRSTTAATGVCNAAQSTLLSLSIVTTGLSVLPFGATCTVGTPVMFVGREPTQ